MDQSLAAAMKLAQPPRHVGNETSGCHGWRPTRNIRVTGWARKTPTCRSPRRNHRNQMRLAAFASIRHCVRAVGIESSFDRAHESPSDAEQWLHGMEELSYATCEASFEAKSSDEGRSGVGCRRPVSITSGGRIRSDQWVGGGYADDEEQHPGAPNHTRRRGNLRRQPGDVLRFRQGKHWSARVPNTGSARVPHTACQRRLRRL
jgi:hypothetical protein